MVEVYNRDMGKMSYKQNRYQNWKRLLLLPHVFYAQFHVELENTSSKTKNSSMSSLIDEKMATEESWNEAILSKAAKK